MAEFQYSIIKDPEIFMEHRLWQQVCPISKLV